MPWNQKSSAERGGKSQCPGWAVTSATDRVRVGLGQEVSEQHPPSRSPWPPLCHPTLSFSHDFPHSTHASQIPFLPSSPPSFLPSSLSPFLSSFLPPSLPSFLHSLVDCMSPPLEGRYRESRTVFCSLQCLEQCLACKWCSINVWRQEGKAGTRGNQESREGEREAGEKIPSTETDSCPFSSLPSSLVLLSDLSYFILLLLSLLLRDLPWCLSSPNS